MTDLKIYGVIRVDARSTVEVVMSREMTDREMSAFVDYVQKFRPVGRIHFPGFERIVRGGVNAVRRNMGEMTPVTDEIWQSIVAANPDAKCIDDQDEAGRPKGTDNGHSDSHDTSTRGE